MNAPFRFALFTVLLSLMSTFTAVAAPGSVIWHSELHETSTDYSATLIGAASGRVVVAGASVGPSGQDVRIRTHDASTGALLWEAVYDRAGGYEFATDLIVTSTDVIVVGGGQASTAGNVDILVLSYSLASGSLQWASWWDHAGGEDAALGADLKGWRLALTGQSQNGPTASDWDAVTQVYDIRTGRLIWSRRLDAVGGWDLGSDVALSGSRAVIVGYATGTDHAYDLLVAAYSLQTGARLWSTLYDGGGASRGLAAAAQGSTVYAVGDISSSPAADADMMIRAYAADTGTLVWADQYDAAGFYDSAYDVDVGSGAVVITGEGRPQLFSPDILTRAYDATTGSLLWSRQYDVDGQTDQSWAVSVAAGQAFVSGSGYGQTTSHDWVVRAHDLATGAVVWQERLDRANGSDSARGVTTLGHSVYVVGTTQEAGTGSPGSHGDATVRAYSR